MRCGKIQDFVFSCGFNAKPTIFSNSFQLSFLDRVYCYSERLWPSRSLPFSLPHTHAHNNPSELNTSSTSAVFVKPLFAFFSAPCIYSCYFPLISFYLFPSSFSVFFLSPQHSCGKGSQVSIATCLLEFTFE